MQKAGETKRIIIYCLVSIVIVTMILLNLHNEKFSSIHTADDFILKDEAVTVTDNAGCKTDWTTGYNGVFATTNWFFIPNWGAYELRLTADTLGEGNTIEVYCTDGRSDELIHTASVYAGIGTSISYFKAKANIKYIQIRVSFDGEGYIDIKNLEIYSDRAYSDTFFVAAIAAIILVLIGLYVFIFRKHDSLYEYKRERLVDYAVLLVAAVFVSHPTFMGYLFTSHDILFHLSRIDAIKDSLLAGQFPVRLYISEAVGYGYGGPLFYPDIFLYIPAVFRILGVSQQLSYTSFLFIINVATALISYYAANRIFKNRYTSLLMSLIYTTAIYRLVNIYTRGAIGEITAMVFLPLIAAGLYEIFYGDKKKCYLAAIGYTGVIQSHILSVLIVLFFSIIFGLVFLKRILKERRWMSLVAAGLLTLSVNIFFIGPFIEIYTGFSTNIDNIHVTSYLMSRYMNQFFDIFVNSYGDSLGLGSMLTNQMSFTLGLPIIFSVLAFLVWLVVRKRNTKYSHIEKIALCFMIFGIITIWMMSRNFPLQGVINSAFGEIINQIQFPWRMLSIATVCFAFTGAVGLEYIGMYFGNKRIMGVILSVVIAIIAGSFLYGIMYTVPTGTVYGEPIYRYDPVIDRCINYREYVPYGFELYYDDLKQLEREPLPTNIEMEIISFKNTNKELTFNYSGGSGEVILPVIYYPGYTASNSKGEFITVEVGSDCLAKVFLENDKDNITIRYTGRHHWIVYNLISLVSLLFSILWVYRDSKKGKQYIH